MGELQQMFEVISINLDCLSFTSRPGGYIESMYDDLLLGILLKEMSALERGLARIYAGQGCIMQELGTAVRRGQQPTTTT